MNTGSGPDKEGGVLELIIKNIHDTLTTGNAAAMKELTEKAVSQGILPSLIIRQGLEPAMREIGSLFRQHRINIPEVLMVSRAMHASLYVLKPFLTKTKFSNRGRIVLGTVAGDLHDIGKNMVGMMLTGAGFQVIDIGIDVPAAGFVDAVLTHHPDVLAMSALLTTSMSEFRDVISLLEIKDIRRTVKVMVGGTPVTPEFARIVGADHYASDAWDAVKVVEGLLVSRSRSRLIPKVVKISKH